MTLSLVHAGMGVFFFLLGGESFDGLGLSSLTPNLHLNATVSQHGSAVFLRLFGSVAETWYHSNQCSILYTP